MKSYILDIEQLNNEPCFKECFALLHDNRKEKVEILKNLEKKKSSIGAGLLLQYVLNNEGLSGLQDEMQYSQKGKPYFSNQKVHFNISHSACKVFFTMSDKNIGCDIEKVREKIPRFPEKILSGIELAYFKTLSEIEQKKYFFQIWTMKESIAKWNGLGLALPFSEITVMKNHLNMETIVYDKTTVYLYPGQLDDYMWCICSEEKNVNVTPELLTISEIL